MRIKKIFNYLFGKKSILMLVVINLLFMIIPVDLFISEFVAFDIKGEYQNIDSFAYKNVDNINNLYKSNFDKIEKLYIYGHKIEISGDKKYIRIYSRTEKQSIKYEVYEKNAKIYLINPIKQYEVIKQILKYTFLIFLCLIAAFSSFVVLLIMFSD